MGLFSDVNKHSQSGGGQWWQKGNYRAKIDRVVFKDGFKGQSYIIECEVLKSDNPEIDVGDKVSQVIKLDKTPALGNIASFLRVCFATMEAKEGNIVDPTKLNVEESDVEASYGAEQPLVGLEVEVFAYMTKTKVGGDFTVVTYKVPTELTAKAA